MTGPDSGGRKSVDSELNLIPFIDLLSVCILFLLMTAVWVQISKMSAVAQPSGETTITHSEVSQLNEQKEDRDFDILIRTSDVEILQDGRTIGKFPVETILDTLQKLKARTSNANPKVSLRSEDDVVYEDVIKVLDSLFTIEWTQVSIGGLR